MRTQTRSIVTALVLLSLVSGAVGCRSNGTGSWYNPKSYSWHNPFKEGATEAPPYGSEAPAHAGTKPSLDAKPNVSTPPGGYANPGKEADFFAGSHSGNAKAVQTQYGHGPAEETKVASNPYSVPEMPNAATAYTATPMTEPYNPSPSVYGLPAESAPANITASGHQQVRYYEPQNPMVPAPSQTVPVAESMPMYGTPNPGLNSTAVQPGQTPYVPMPAPAASPSPAGSYAPQTTASPYANAEANYGVPAATPYSVDPRAGQAAPFGYTASPSTYQPMTGTY